MSGDYFNYQPYNNIIPYSPPVGGYTFSWPAKDYRVDELLARVEKLEKQVRRLRRMYMAQRRRETGQ